MNDRYTKYTHMSEYPMMAAGLPYAEDATSIVNDGGCNCCDVGETCGCECHADDCSNNRKD